MPFQFGPRVCLGMRLANNTMELLLQTLVSRRNHKLFFCFLNTPS